VLEKLDNFSGRDGPLVLIIMDGMGLGKQDENNAFHLANTPYLDKLQTKWPEKKLYAVLKAHGTAVGLPTDAEMGNSEVGHNAIGAGIVPKQRATLAKEAILSKEIFKNQAWIDISKHLVDNYKTLHFFGLLSDGYVHSHITHLLGLLDGAVNSGIKKVRVHTLFDGRDVPPQSAGQYIDELERKLKDINAEEGFDYLIASGGGRMRVTMDRYNSDWDVVRRGWEAHVCAIPERFPSYKGYFLSAQDAINQARIIDSDIIDQFLPSFVVVNEGKFPLGKMEDGDVVINFNFRGDRAIQISRAFDEGEDFKDFEKKCNTPVHYFGLLQYDDKLNIPQKYFIEPPKIDKSIIDYLSEVKIPMFAISETHKIGHLTYFFCGNRDLKIKSENIEEQNTQMIMSHSSNNEIYFEVISDPAAEIKDKPKMKAYEIKAVLTKAIVAGKYKFIRVNFANGDMVGHTGVKSAAMIAAETVDECVKEVVELVETLNGIAIVTADHGNLEDMSGKVMTAHTTNPVMFAIIDSGYNGEYTVKENVEDLGLGNIAATILNLLGYKSPDNFLESLLSFK
jgi:2,3-bisphosphoglycerate-independent phosphoglycerate mutase